MMKKITKLMIALVALVALGTACSKYPGFTKDKSGLYYKFHVQNKDSVQAQMDDIVEIFYNLRTVDSLLAENAYRIDMVGESLFSGDYFDALRKMRLGDSATFIMNGDTFFHYFMGQPFPFEKKELYFDIKLTNIMSKEQFEEKRAERMKQNEIRMEELRVSEDSLINAYLVKNDIKVKPTASGLYFMKKVSGKGKAIVKGSKVQIHYTGTLLDGTVFDSSVARGEPIELVTGEGSVISGWEEALLLMKEGDHATVLIPSKLAYGNRGAGNTILPYTPLIFDMEIVTVE